ncbi:aldo/keto reductase [Lactococcus lactis subsp. lactis]|uniref:aldo/keto reductase n=1 Tax=Lactococcus lactis TaxID=1358 RepID=UPI0022E41176|nr:aldo/keto reductase [Lactococcus lactis]WKB47405.1 aldo/keto reductase [Lactococcus lactis subsp. lactis]WNN69046.1 aldo/keto reductase [Lactococcus lactis]WPK08218.1 aldo/keto reductase [Lactococcus lactis]
MKKIVFTMLALGFSLIVLSGCQTREDSSDWLQGDWYSKDWNVTYTIIMQNDDDWVIKDGEHTIARCSQEYTDENNKKEIELVSKKGTEFHITPIDKTHIKFQQVSKDGTLGTTDAVEFVKKQY